MSHHIYQTEGFVIEAVPVDESNKLFTLFTKDLGLIHASAQGIRLLKSKLRYSLQELSFSSIAVVRGKEIWRITSARKLISLFDKRLPIPVRKMMARVLLFVKRLMPEEGKNEEIFNVLSMLSGFLFAHRDVFVNNPKSSETVEVLTKLRILKILGYGTNNTALQPFVAELSFSEEIVEQFQNLLADAQTEISRALEESHL